MSSSRSSSVRQPFAKRYRGRGVGGLASSGRTLRPCSRGRVSVDARLQAVAVPRLGRARGLPRGVLLGESASRRRSPCRRRCRRAGSGNGRLPGSTAAQGAGTGHEPVFRSTADLYSQPSSSPSPSVSSAQGCVPIAASSASSSLSLSSSVSVASAGPSASQSGGGGAGAGGTGGAGGAGRWWSSPVVWCRARRPGDQRRRGAGRVALAEALGENPDAKAAAVVDCERGQLRRDDDGELGARGGARLGEDGGPSRLKTTVVLPGTKLPPVTVRVSPTASFSGATCLTVGYVFPCAATALAGTHRATRAISSVRKCGRQGIAWSDRSFRATLERPGGVCGRLAQGLRHAHRAPGALAIPRRAREEP